MSLQNRKVLVTGATGFIGGRLAQRLATEAGTIVTATGRRFDAVPFLAEAGVTLLRADVTDPAALRPLVQGQEIIFHLAVSNSPDLERARPVNVAAVELLARLAAEAGVGRLVHVSTIAAYGVPRYEVMSEDRPLEPDQTAAYGKTKAEGEWRLRAVAAETGLPITIARPAMVYGPRSPGWSVNMLRLVQRRIPTIFGDGSGHAHPVYIDNLIDGLILQASRPEAIGEAFNFCDGPLPWRDFFGYYGAMCGRKPIRLPLFLAKAGLNVYKAVSGRAEDTNDLLAFYTSHAVYPTTKVERLLGYRPRVSIEDGMRQTEQWFRENGYLG